MKRLITYLRFPVAVLEMAAGDGFTIAIGNPGQPETVKKYVTDIYYTLSENYFRSSLKWRITIESN